MSRYFNNELLHSGVKGMRWGIRHERKKTPKDYSKKELDRARKLRRAGIRLGQLGIGVGAAGSNVLGKQSLWNDALPYANIHHPRVGLGLAAASLGSAALTAHSYNSLRRLNKEAAGKKYTTADKRAARRTTAVLMLGATFMNMPGILSNSVSIAEDSVEAKMSKKWWEDAANFKDEPIDVTWREVK